MKHRGLENTSIASLKARGSGKLKELLHKHEHDKIVNLLILLKFHHREFHMKWRKRMVIFKYSKTIVQQECILSFALT